MQSFMRSFLFPGLLLLGSARCNASGLSAPEPCCEGACTVAGQEKYWSIAQSVFGVKHCG